MSLTHDQRLLIPQGWNLIEITGSDARDFLQRITAADFRELTEGEWTEGTLLAATGKIQVYFRVWMAGPALYRLFTPWDAKAAHAHFERMHFGEKLSITPLTWEQFRIEEGIAAYPTEITETTNPLEVGLDAAVHENKGCYPGQEVLEKIRTVGKVPRLLVRVEGAGSAPQCPAALMHDGRDVGAVTSSAASARFPDRWIGLALAQRAALNTAGAVFALSDGKTVNLAQQP